MIHVFFRKPRSMQVRRRLRAGFDWIADHLMWGVDIFRGDDNVHP